MMLVACKCIFFPINALLGSAALCDVINIVQRNREDDLD